MMQRDYSSHPYVCDEHISKLCVASDSTNKASAQIMHLSSTSSINLDDVPVPFIFNISHAKYMQDACYALHNSLMSNEISSKASKWLRTNMSIGNFKSVIPFPIATNWDKGITKINVHGLAKIGLNVDRCRALYWGFDLGLARLPPYQRCPPENYASLTPFGDLVLSKLLKDADRGVIELFDPLPDNHYLFHPLGAVPKGDDDCRIVVDTSATGLNDSIFDTEMSLPSLSSILNSLKQGWVACTYDLSSGFYQLPLRQDMPNFVCIRLPNGKCGRFRFICFGLKCAPFLFQGTMMDIRNLLIDRGVVNCAILVYIDDFILAAHSKEVLEQNRQDFEKVMHWIGLLLNDEKRSEINTTFHAIGYEIDTVNLRVSLIPKKFEKRRTLLDSLISNKRCCWSDFQSIAGKLNHLASVTIGGKFFMHPWWKIMKSTLKLFLDISDLQNPKQSQPSASFLVDMSNKEVMESILWWHEILQRQNAPSKPILVRLDGFLDIISQDFASSLSHLPFEGILQYADSHDIFVLTSDASASGGGWFYKNWSLGFSYIWSPETAFASSNFRELVTIEIAIKHALSLNLLKRSKAVFCRSDNTVSVAAMNKQRSDFDNPHSIMRRIMPLLIENQLDSAAIHIPGKLNTRADQLSRITECVWSNANVTRTFKTSVKQSWSYQKEYFFLTFSSISDWSSIAQLKQATLRRQKDIPILIPHPNYAIQMIQTFVKLSEWFQHIIVAMPTCSHPIFPAEEGPAHSLLKKFGFLPDTWLPFGPWVSASFQKKNDLNITFLFDEHVQNEYGSVTLSANIVLWSLSNSM